MIGKGLPFFGEISENKNTTISPREIPFNQGGLLNQQKELEIIPFDEIEVGEEQATYPQLTAEEIERLLDYKRNKHGMGKVSEVYSLDSEILLRAPENFFDKYEPIVKELVEYIQDGLSNSGNANLIETLKKDPTNKTNKEKAYTSIYKEYMEYNSSTKNIEYSKLRITGKSLCLVMAFNEICGLGVLEPLFNDKRIREIICNGPKDIQVEIKGRLYKVPSCKFRDENHLMELINKLFASVNRVISRTSPYGNANLSDNSRVFATHRAIAPQGPNLNIRSHSEDWVSPDQLIKWGSASTEVFEWLGQRIHAGISFIVNGGTSTGKTTMLSALCGFLPNNKRIVTIEKYIELKMPKGKLVAAAMETIPRKTIADTSIEITLRDLVVCTTQMRPDVIILGESTGAEAYDLAQAANTGHQAGTTVHSNTSKDCPTRMMSLISQSDLIKGKEALELLSAGLDIIITVKRFPQDGSRKIVDISEIGTDVLATDAGVLYLPVKPIWQFMQEKTEDLTDPVKGTWVKVGELSEEREEKLGLKYIKMKNFEELAELYRPYNKDEEETGGDENAISI